MKKNKQKQQSAIKVILIVTLLLSAVSAIVAGCSAFEHEESAKYATDILNESASLPKTELGSIDFGGTLRGTYFHVPEPVFPQDGVFMKPVEYLQNAACIAYAPDGDGLKKLESEHFSGQYTVLNNDIKLDFDWVSYDNRVFCSFLPESMDHVAYLPGLAGSPEKLMIQLALQISDKNGDSIYSQYPVFLNLLTGEMTDFLSGCNDAVNMSIYNAFAQPEKDAALLTDRDGNIFYYDMKNKRLTSLDELTGARISEAHMTGKTFCAGIFFTLKRKSIREIYIIYGVLTPGQLQKKIRKKYYPMICLYHPELARALSV